MISNQVLQNTIDGLKNITKMDFAISDVEGKHLVSTFQNLEVSKSELLAFADSQADAQTIRDYQFFKVYKDNFIKNLLLDNLLLVDIYNRAKKLHIEPNVRRLVYIVECSPERSQSASENIRALLGTKTDDFITAVDEKSIIVVKELDAGADAADAEQIADQILKAAGQDAEEATHIAYGTIVGELKEVSRSYKEAKMAMDVGKIFFEERSIIAYSSLGIGRLIYQLPIPLCKMFIKEIFANKSPDDFDEETLTTINKFFENNLNVSETSRQLYIHRNTLVYRLDKLQKSTGLDLRVFEDAITFKIALMVVKYMKYMESTD